MSENKKENLYYARDKKCIMCMRRAVAFWPVIDPDIRSNPYCRKCLDDAKTRVLLQMAKIDEDYENKKTT